MNSAESEWKLYFDKCFDVWNASIQNTLPEKSTKLGSDHNYSSDDNPNLEESSVPDKVAAIVDKLFSNNRRFEHIINLLSHEIVSTAVESGFCGGNHKKEESLHEALKSSDKDAIGAVIGFKLYDRCIQRARKTPKLVLVDSKVDPEMARIPMYPVLTTPIPSNEPLAQSSSKSDVRVSKESAWAYAYNLVNVNDSTVNNAVKVAKVMFDEVMTKDEVTNGSMRSQYIGEGSKRRKTEPFDPEKLNFIRDACAFVLNTPDRKQIGTTNFELARNDPQFKTLPPDVWQGLKMPVFSKHASLQRKKFEDEDEIKIINVTSISAVQFEPSQNR